MNEWLREDKVRYQSPSLGRVLAWAANAAQPDPLAAHLTPIWHSLHDDWLLKTKRWRVPARKVYCVIRLLTVILAIECYTADECKDMVRHFPL